jgi:hypothetical protein
LNVGFFRVTEGVTDITQIYVCVTEGVTDITQIYAINEEPVHEFELCAMID